VENWVGGTNLRGYVYRQFTGDTQFSTQVEYHFPLIKVWEIQLRGLVFTDGAAIWFRKLPPKLDPSRYAEREDGRQYLPPQFLTPGFDRERDVHGAAGFGFRFFIKSLAVPLVGADFGRGFGRDAPWRMVLVIGA
jgi:outer membrane protein assembly factor BamA